MDWAQVLVIILAIFLAIFLLLGIVLIALLIKITRQIKAVTDSARTTAETIEHAVTRFGKITSPVISMRMVTKFMKKPKRQRQGEDA